MPAGYNKKDDISYLYDKIDEFNAELRKRGIRTKIDDRENVSRGFKFNYWELKGVPLRIELGPRDFTKK